jgi:hypothetical protein
MLATPAELILALPHHVSWDAVGCAISHPSPMSMPYDDAIATACAQDRNLAITASRLLESTVDFPEPIECTDIEFTAF